MKRLLLLVLLFPALALATDIPYQAEVLVLNSAAVQLPQSTGRRGQNIQNLGPYAIFCAFTKAGAVVNKAHKIAALGGEWSLEAAAERSVFCIAATADQVTTAATIVSEL